MILFVDIFQTVLCNFHLIWETPLHSDFTVIFGMWMNLQDTKFRSLMVVYSRFVVSNDYFLHFVIQHLFVKKQLKIQNQETSRMLFRYLNSFPPVTSLASTIKWSRPLRSMLYRTFHHWQKNTYTQYFYFYIPFYKVSIMLSCQVQVKLV